MNTQHQYRHQHQQYHWQQQWQQQGKNLIILISVDQSCFMSNFSNITFWTDLKHLFQGLFFRSVLFSAINLIFFFALVYYFTIIITLGFFFLFTFAFFFNLKCHLLYYISLFNWWCRWCVSLKGFFFWMVKLDEEAFLMTTICSPPFFYGEWLTACQQLVSQTQANLSYSLRLFCICIWN